MKAKFFLMLGLLLLPAVLVVADTPFGIEPENPKQSEQLIVSYNPAHPGAKISEPRQPELYVLFWPLVGDPVFKSYPLRPADGLWKASLQPLPDMLAMQYKIVDGTLSDDLGGLFGDVMFYDSEDAVLPGAYVALGRSFLFEKYLPYHITQAEMIRQTNGPLATALFEEELKRNPSHTLAAYYYIQGMRWSLDKADDRRAHMQKALAFAEKVIASHPDDPYAMSAYVHAQQQFGSRHKAVEISKMLITNYAGHPAAEEFMAWEAAFPAGGANPANRIQAGKHFLAYYPNSSQAVVADVMIPSYVALGQFQEAKDWLDQFAGARAHMYQLLGNEARKSGNVPALAIICLEKALAMWNNTGDIPQPSYITPREWLEDPYEGKRHITRVNLPMDYALALSAAGRHEDAVLQATIACGLNNGEDLKIITSNIKVLTDAGRLNDALDEVHSTMLSDMWDEDFLLQYKELYELSYGSAEGFDQKVEDLMIQGMTGRYRGKLISEPASDFTVQMHGGGELKLSDLKGKVVVLDFWALWCGPCMMAFPYFQQAKEYYADNPDVVFLAINTMENIQGEQLIQRVQSWLDNNGYTFQVVYDYNRTAVAQMYGVQGIPTKITFGRDNNIRFRDVGFGGEEMFLNIRAQIDLLLEE